MRPTAAHPDEQLELCADIPPGVTGGQDVRVVVQYIEARSSRMHEPLVSLALEAIVLAWPCRK